jgi:hypothetical protein
LALSLLHKRRSSISPADIAARIAFLVANAFDRSAVHAVCLYVVI